MIKLISDFIEIYPGPYCFRSFEGDETSFDFFCESTRRHLFTIQSDSEDCDGARMKLIASAVLFSLDATCNPVVREAV